jgi:iron(III) transport system substrate-binding protein
VVKEKGEVVNGTHRVTRRYTRAGIGAVTLSLALAVGAAACSTGVSSTPPTGQVATSPVPIDKLVATSHQEHGLIIYGNAPAQYFQPVVKAFEQKYPWISVQDNDLSDFQVFSKYESEHAQGSTSADLLIASGIGPWLEAEKLGALQHVTPSGLSNFPAYTNQGNGLFVMSPEPVLSAYNEKLLTPSQVPRTYGGLAQATQQNPSAYKLATYTINNSLGYSAVYGLMHILGTSTFWREFTTLAANSKTFGDGLSGLTYMLQGGASVGYMTSGLSQGVLPHFQGLANYVFMKDATPLVPRGIALAQGARNPASAQLFLDFLFSDAGQQALCGAGFEASENGFTASNGCTANLTQLHQSVPEAQTYLVPYSNSVLTQQKSITDHWNRIFHTGA